MHFRLLTVLLACAGGAWLTAQPAAPAAEYFFHHDHVIGTSLDLHVITATEADAAACEQAVLAEIERLRQIFSTYDPASEINRLNRVGVPVPISADMLAVLREYDNRQRLSHGAFNGQLGELVRVWKNAEQEGQEPDAATLARIVEQINRPGWEVDAARRTVTRLTDQPLNLNSVARGYIIQRAATAARTRVPALRGLLLNLGGDLSVWDPDGTGWTVAVQDPARPEDNAPPRTLLRLRDRAVASSGNYERYYTINGKLYSHIFDPRTGRPAEGVAGSTVVARDNITANALATTLCVLPPAEGLALVAATPGAECLVIAADGKEHRSAGWAALELPRAAQAGGDKGKAGGWPEGFQVNIELTLPTPKGGRKVRRPYVAVWAENADGKPVRTVTVWGKQPRWIPELTRWWKFARDDRKLVKAVTRATRAPGKYHLAWDGKDDQGKPLPKGTYTLHVEVHREHGKHVTQTGKIVCGEEPARITLAANAETGETVVEYAKKKATP